MEKLDQMTAIEKAYVEVAQKVIDYYAPVEALSSADKANFEKTPERAARAWAEIARYVDSKAISSVCKERFNSLTCSITPKAKIVPALKKILATSFPMEDSSYSSGLVIEGPILFESLCPHHLLPVKACAFVGYKPKDRVLGLSKIPRALKLLGSRPVLQEQLCRDMADVLFLDKEQQAPHLVQIETEGSAVQIIATHGCMTQRGVHSDASTLTTEIRGCFYQPEIKKEFYEAIESIMQTRSLIAKA